MRKFLILAVVVACAVPARANDETSWTVRPRCTTNCTTTIFSPRGPRPIPEWPKELRRHRIEGYIAFHVSVTEQGDAGDIAAGVIVGPRSMVDDALAVVKTWKWYPLLQNGAPVSRTINAIVEYRLPETITGARRKVMLRYNEANELLKQQKLAEARAVLEKLEADEEDLILYERGMIANALAMIAYRQGDFLEAFELAYIANHHSAKVLPQDVVISLAQTRLLAALARNEFGAAMLAERQLASLQALHRFSRLPEQLNAALAKADVQPVISTAARIPAVHRADVAEIHLYRRKFAFKNVLGSLERFTLKCKQQNLTGTITEGQEWYVPDDLSACAVDVVGKPGTTFNFEQMTGGK